jgi:hypothetical protein
VLKIGLLKLFYKIHSQMRAKLGLKDYSKKVRILVDSKSIKNLEKSLKEENQNYWFNSKSQEMYEKVRFYANMGRDPSLNTEKKITRNIWKVNKKGKFCKIEKLNTMKLYTPPIENKLNPIRKSSDWTVGLSKPPLPNKMIFQSNNSGLNSDSKWNESKLNLNFCHEIKVFLMLKWWNFEF